jgi:3-oxoadipate enol-lactonase
VTASRSVTGPVPGEVGYADHEGVAIAYQVLGRRGPWLGLVHGLGYGRLGWGPFATRLAANRRIVLVDNRGIGQSDSPPGPYTVDDMAGDVLAVLDHLGLDRCDLVGASLGGMVVLQVAASHHERLRRMVLIASTPGEPQGKPLPASTRALLRGQLGHAARTERRLIEGALAPTTVATRPDLVDRLMDLWQEQAQPADAWEAQAAASAEFGLRSQLGRLTTPTLAISGLDDAVIDPGNTMTFAFALPNARAFYVAPAGHLCIWEEPELLADAIDEFLGGTSGGHDHDRSDIPPEATL